MHVKITVIGAAGRMGKEIIKSISSNSMTELVGAIERKGSPYIGMDSGEIAGAGKNNILITDNSEEAIANCDVTIDFSTPESTFNHIEFNKKFKKSTVIGTTGISDTTIIKNASNEIPIVFSPNMSVGVNLLFKITELTSKILSNGYDIEIIEAHHRFKKDSPSGTAKKLLQIIVETLNRDLQKDVVYGRNGVIGERRAEEIGVFAVRGGDIVGEHTVIFAGIGERIELVHKAHSRSTFANGAIKAAIFVKNQKPGLYSMFDVLGL